MPKDLLKSVQVWIPKNEYKDYKRSPIFKGLDLQCWPTYVDCIPKKRRYLYENIVGDYMAIDDDLKLMVWDNKKKNFSPALDAPEKFERGLVRSYAHLTSGVANVGLANTFMTSMKINEKKTFEFNDVPFCFAGFSGDRPKIRFNTFFFTDIAMPMQIMQANRKVLTAAYCAYSMRSNKKLASTGTTPYRTSDVIKYSAVSLAQQMRGHVTGLRETGNLGGGWSLQKTFQRPNLERANAFLREFAAREGLESLPKLVDLDLKTPMEELFRIYRKNWESAKKGKGNPIP
jgi:hypothetical protein